MKPNEQQEQKEFLRSIYPFNQLSEACFQTLIDCLQYEKYKGGDLLAKRGEFGDKLYIVLEGRFYFCDTGISPEKYTEGDYSAGSIIGEFSLLGNIPRVANIYALRDSLVASLSRDDFLKILQKYPEFLHYLAEMAFKKITKPVSEIIKARFQVKTIAFIPSNGINKFIDHIQFLKTLLCEMPKCLFLDSENYKSKTHCTDINDSLKSWLNHAENDYEYVFYWADSSLTPWTELCARQSDSIIILAQGEEKNYALSETEEHINRCYENIPTRKVLALFHDPSTRCPKNTSEWLSPRKNYNYVHLRMGEKRDVDRLLRMVMEKSLALVLAGGGARGIAHLGLLKYLHEHNIDVDYIAGCSMGAIFASWYAMGFQFPEILETGVKYLKKTVKMDYTFPYLSLARGKNIYDNFFEIYGDLKIEDLWINFFCNSADLKSGDICVHQQGYVWKAVRASLSLPIIFPPVSFGEALMIDGGVLNNIPVSQMKRVSHHAYTIASYISGENKMSHFEYPNHVSGLSLLYQKLIKKRQPASLNIIELVIRLMSLASLKENKKMLEIADAVINFDMRNYNLLDFDKYEAIIEESYQATKTQMEKITLPK